MEYRRTGIMAVMVDTPANGGLTAAQEAFALEYVRTRNQRAAYRAAYAITSMNQVTLGKRAQEVFNCPEVKARIQELIDAAAGEATVTITEILAWLKEIAMADPREIVAVQRGACRYCNGLEHRYHWRLREYEEEMARIDALMEHEAQMAALSGKAPKDHPLPDPGGGLDYDATAEPHPNCPECHGVGLTLIIPQDTALLSRGAQRLIRGVKMTPNGPEILLHDQVRVMELVGKIAGAFKDDSPKTLQLELKGMAAVVHTEAKDPLEAARMYQDMIAGRPAK